MKRQQGFTLIELVIVIVILGILATTAIPKFVSLQTDARISTLNGLRGAIAGANSLIYSRALVQGLQKAATTTNVNIGNGVDVPTQFGYMVATNTALATGLNITLQAASVTNPTADWLYTSASGSPARIIIRQNGAPANNCYLTYIQATATTLPKVDITTNDC